MAQAIGPRPTQLVLFLLCLPLLSCLQKPKDRQEHPYSTVQIGQQVWLAQNLRMEHPKSWCFTSDSTVCSLNGRLYTWAAAMDLPDYCDEMDCKAMIHHPHQGLCPQGWHIPTLSEWDTLFSQYGDKKNAGAQLKAQGEWPNTASETPFKALPAGMRYLDGRKAWLGTLTYYWSADQEPGNGDRWASAINLHRKFFGIGIGNLEKHYGFSVRCLKDH